MAVQDPHSESHRRMLAYRPKEPARLASSPRAAGMSWTGRIAGRIRKAWLSHPVEKGKLGSHYDNLLPFPIEFVKKNPEYSYHSFHKNRPFTSPRQGQDQEIPTSRRSDGHVELAFLPGLAGPRHGPESHQMLTHGSLQELRTCPHHGGVICMPVRAVLIPDLADRHCHDTCKNLYFFVAFPCSVLTMRSQREKDVRGCLIRSQTLKPQELGVTAMTSSMMMERAGMGMPGNGHGHDGCRARWAARPRCPPARSG